MGLYYKELECGCVVSTSTLEWPYQSWVSSPCNEHKKEKEEQAKKREEHDQSSTNQKK